MLVWFDLYVVTMKGSVYPQKSLCGLRHLKMMSWPPSPVFCSQKMLPLGTQATPLLLLTGALHCLSLTVHSFLHGQQWLLHLSDMRRALGNATVSVFFHLAVPCMSSFTLAFFSFQVYLSFFFLWSKSAQFLNYPSPATSSQILLGLYLSAPPWNLSRYQEFCQSPGVVCVTRRTVWDSPSLAVSFWVRYNVRKTIYRKFILKRSEES